MIAIKIFFSFWISFDVCHNVLVPFKYLNAVLQQLDFI